MKKIIASLCMLLVCLGFASLAAAFDPAEFDFPEGTSEEAIHNTEVLYKTMQGLSEEPLYKSNFFFAAKVLARNDIVIADIQPQDVDANGHWSLLVFDTNGFKYNVVIHTDGGLSQIFREDSKMIYFSDGGLEHIGDDPEPPLKWWQELPNWMQCVLRYIFFGWAWMKPW